MPLRTMEFEAFNEQPRWHFLVFMNTPLSRHGSACPGCLFQLLYTFRCDGHQCCAIHNIFLGMLSIKEEKPGLIAGRMQNPRFVFAHDGPCDRQSDLP